MAVREGILALLRERPCHGYQLKTDFERATGGVWPLNVGQVYKTLERLERDGLVSSSEEDGQRSYAITARGIDELGAWWEAVPADEPPPRDELMLKVLMAIDADRDHAQAVIADQREAVMTQLQLHQRSRRRPRAQDGDPLADQLVHDALLLRAEADLRWLDRCEERLRTAPARPTGDGSSDAGSGGTEPGGPTGRRRRRTRPPTTRGDHS